MMAGVGVKHDAVQLEKIGGEGTPLREGRSKSRRLWTKEPSKPVGPLLQVDPTVRMALEIPSRPDDKSPTHRRPVIFVPQRRLVPQP